MSGSEVLRIVCWQPVLTEHQSATFEALAEFPDVELIAITSRADNPDKPGWLKKASAAMPVRLLRTHAWFGEIRTLLADPDAVHIVASPFDRSRINVALFLALYRKRAVFLLCEPYATIPLGYFGDGRPWLAEFKHRLRPILYRLYGRLLKHRIAGVFAISPRAVDQFRHMGVAPERIYPFGYFVLPSMGHLSRRTGEPRLRCVFIGALIKRKGIATMLGAFAGSPFLQANATLDIYGKGDIAAADLPEGVRYCGVLPPDQPIRGHGGGGCSGRSKPVRRLGCGGQRGDPRRNPGRSKRCGRCRCNGAEMGLRQDFSGG